MVLEKWLPLGSKQSQSSSFKATALKETAHIREQVKKEMKGIKRNGTIRNK